MAWYWEIAILLYFGAGMWMGGFWMNDDGENMFHFMFSVFIIGLFWPLVLIIVLLNETSHVWWHPIKRFFSRINFIRRTKERIERHKEQAELENNYEEDRCERMGLNDEDVWKT